ncbi:16S ribosomal RNA methyltransferase KsgA/Dim1 family protein [compost metagenome]
MDLRLKFNEDVVNYEKMRPTYVEELFQDVIRYSDLNQGKRTLEVGIGTGQATLPFLNTGCEITAIELGEDLAKFSAEKFSRFPHFHVIHSDFESVRLEPEQYDLIYSATAFHWIPQEIGYPKAYQLLRSGGVLALFWNRPFPARKDDLHEAMQHIYAKYAPSSKEPAPHTEQKSLEMVHTLEQYGFADVNFKIYHQTRTFDAPSYVALLNTYSDHRAFPEELRVRIEQEMIEAINHYGGKVELHDTLDLYLARKP